MQVEEYSKYKVVDDEDIVRTYMEACATIQDKLEFTGLDAEKITGDLDTVVKLEFEIAIGWMDDDKFHAYAMKYLPVLIEKGIEGKAYKAQREAASYKSSAINKSSLTTIRLRYEDDGLVWHDTDELYMDKNGALLHTHVDGWRRKTQISFQKLTASKDDGSGAEPIESFLNFYDKAESQGGVIKPLSPAVRRLLENGDIEGIKEYIEVKQKSLER